MVPNIEVLLHIPPREVALELESWRPNFGLVYYLRSSTRSGDALFQDGSYHGLFLRTLAPDSCDSPRVVDFLGTDDKPSVFELVLETDSKFYRHNSLPPGCEERLYATEKSRTKELRFRRYSAPGRTPIATRRTVYRL